MKNGSSLLNINSQNLKNIPLLGWIIAISSIFDCLFGIFITLSDPRWQTYIYFASIVIALSLILWMMIELSNKNNKKAAWIIIIEQSMRGLVTSLVFKNLGLPMQLLVLVIGAVVILEWIPHQNIGPAILSIFAVSFITLGTDLIEIPWQIRGLLPASGKYGIVGGLIILFTIYIILNFKTYQLRIKIILLLLGLSSISIIGVSIATNRVAEQTLLNDAQQSLNSVTSISSNAIDRFISNKLESIQSYAATPDIITFLTMSGDERVRTGSTARIINFLNSIFMSNPSGITSVTILDRNGIIAANSANEGIGENQSYRNYFVTPFTTGNPYISPVFSSQSIDDPALNVSAPIKNEQKESLGVLTVRYKYSVIQDIIAKANNLGGDQSFAILVDENHVVLGHGVEPEFIGTTLKQSEDSSRFDYVTDIDPYSNKLVGDAVKTTVTTNATWQLIVLQPLSVFQEPNQLLTNVIILIAEIVAFLAIIAGNIGARTFTNPILALTVTAEEIRRGNLSIRADESSQNEIGLLARFINRLATHLAETLETLEKRVQARTKTIETASHVGRVISTILDPELLINAVVNEIKKSFSYYHVHIYLADHMNHQLVLVGGSGEVGEVLLQQGHTITFGRGLVGKSGLLGRPIMAQDTHIDPDWLPNPFLPDTSSEVAVPIILGDELLGVLDVQQDQAYSLNEQDITLLELIASQIAVALRNARQYREAQYQAEIQAQLSLISDQIRSTNTVDEAIQTAIHIISRLTGSKRVAAQLKISHSKLDAFLP